MRTEVATVEKLSPLSVERTLSLSLDSLVTRRRLPLYWKSAMGLVAVTHAPKESWSITTNDFNYEVVASRGHLLIANFQNIPESRNRSLALTIASTNPGSESLWPAPATNSSSTSQPFSLSASVSRHAACGWHT